jgi:hypothetical protein
MIRKAVISLAAVLAAVLALTVSTAGHSTSHHAVSEAQARAALMRYLHSYSPAAEFVAGMKPGDRRVGPAAPVGTSRSVTKYESYNWGGYASWKTTAQTYTKAAGSWTVPSVTCTAEDRLAGTWVGLDGFSASDPTVEQDGTFDWCFEGTAHYFAFYEMYPAGSVDVHTVSPGDKITASVSRSGTKYTLKLTDSTHTSSSFTKHGTCSLTKCKDESAEWITERPAFATTGITPLAQISSIAVSSASDTAKGKTAAISKSPNPSELEIIDSTKSYVLWVPSSLGSAGNSFSGKWLNSY